MSSASKSHQLYLQNAPMLWPWGCHNYTTIMGFQTQCSPEVYSNCLLMAGPSADLDSCQWIFCIAANRAPEELKANPSPPRTLYRWLAIEPKSSLLHTKASREKDPWKLPLFSSPFTPFSHTTHVYLFCSSDTPSRRLRQSFCICSLFPRWSSVLYDLLTHLS